MVKPSDEPWLHQLLLAVQAERGRPLLLNSSFNTKGRPICNRISEALALLDDEPELDAVLIGDHLFRKRMAV